MSNQSIVSEFKTSDWAFLGFMATLHVVLTTLWATGRSVTFNEVFANTAIVILCVRIAVLEAKLRISNRSR